MKQPIKVVHLPTEDQTYQVKEGDYFINDSREHSWGKLEALKCERITAHGHAWNGSGIQTYINHLYITVSQDVEPIKEGDYLIHNNVVVKCLKGEKWLGERKIIATTDPKLIYSPNWKGKEVTDCLAIPQVQQSFLKEYVSNPEGEWEVEYEFKRVECYNYNGDHIGKSCSCKSGDFRDVYELKLNQDNTVNITSVEEKMYSRKEVESILFQYAEDEHAWFSCKSEVDSFNNWIKENL